MNLAPLIGYTLLVTPGILPKALIATSSVFGGCSLYAYMRP